ncbi:MAG: HEAT repeat domain-containing protein, partial [Vampirovibrionia bacterium]
AVESLVKRANTSNSKQRATEGLISALSSFNTDVRMVSVKALSQLQSQRAKEGLKQALNDQNATIRNIAQKALND